MTAAVIDSTTNKVPNSDIFYPSSDGEPLAESYDHLYVIMTTLTTLLARLKEQQATVLADQFLYYLQGFPRLRVAPDLADGVRLLPLEELNIALQQQIEQTDSQAQRADRESQRSPELEAQLASYRQQLGGLPPT